MDNINPKLGAVNTNIEATTSLDLPPQIQAILNMSGNGQNMAMPMVPSYQEGGMVQPAGVNVQPQQSQPMSTAMLEMEVNQMAAQNPELVARVRAGIEAGLQSGELTMRDLNMAVQLAKTVIQNPSMYPQIRQFAIQKGLATAEELPVEYDEGLIIALLIVAKSLDTDVQFPGQSEQPVQQMQDGGVLKGPSHDQGGIPVKVAGVNNAEMEGGEYVIPKHIVKAKGTEFFDKMLANYEDKA